MDNSQKRMFQALDNKQIHTSSNMISKRLLIILYLYLAGTGKMLFKAVDRSYLMFFTFIFHTYF